MPYYQIFATAKHNGMPKRITLKDFPSSSVAIGHFMETYKTLQFTGFVKLAQHAQSAHEEKRKTPDRRKNPTKSLASIRNKHHGRLCSLRNNLQSFAEVDGITQEESLVLCQAACKLSRIIALFKTRTMEIESGGTLKC